MEEKQENEKKGNLLIVDDDVSFLKLLEIQLKKHFNIVCARSGPEALEIIQKGFNPGVILSDLNMPIINGIEFLKETMKCVPHSIRIILSAFANPQEIISAINQSRAYMYLMKPIDQLQLIQVIKNAFETYNLIVKNNQLLETLKKIGITEAKEVEIITNSPQQQIAQKVGIEFVSALQKILSFSEKYYFTNHKSSVVAISKGLAEALKFSDRTTEEIVIAASLINITTLSMPKRFHLYDPYDLEQADRKFYFKLFSQTIESLEPVSAIRGSVTILSQIWENRIGSGGPKQVEGNKLLP
ncbi:MAG: response regulator, partial [Candidatus Kapaibacteriota bacterium]